jgi:hypothetical protein
MLYVMLLFLYGLIILFLILLGSHGKLILNNPETIQYLCAVFLYVTTGVLIFRTRNAILSKRFRLLLIVLNVLVLAALVYQVVMLYPYEFTLQSLLFWSTQLLGVICSLFVIFKYLALENIE